MVWIGFAISFGAVQFVLNFVTRTKTHPFIYGCWAIVSMLAICSSGLLMIDKMPIGYGLFGWSFALVATGFTNIVFDRNRA